MLHFLFWIAILLCVIHVLLNYNSTARAIRKIPGPHDVFVVGNALEVMVSPAKFMALGREWAKKFPGIHRFWSCPNAAVIIYNPEDIEEHLSDFGIFSDKSSICIQKVPFGEVELMMKTIDGHRDSPMIVTSSMKHSEKGPLYNFMKPWLQDGLLLSKGEKWQARRKILTPTFHFNILRQFSGALRDNARRLTAELAAAAARPVDVVPLISDFTLSSICETAMGTKLNQEKTKAGKLYKEAINKMGSIIGYRTARVYLSSDFIFNLTSNGRLQNKIKDIIHSFTTKVIRERKENLENVDVRVTPSDGGKADADNDIFMKKSKKVAMLDLLISAEKDGLIDSTGIQEEVDTFMFEGHDTTASGLTFCMLLLANNKHIQDKAADEIYNKFADSHRPIVIDDLPDLRYLECCIKESLRIYPPVHLIGRTLTEDVKLSNYDVPAGVQCLISIIDLHNREDLFPSPAVFDPDRFLPENCARRHPYAYIPFSAGPRNCIGQKFAMLEMKLVLAEVLRQFELQPVTRPEDLVFEADLVLRNNAPVYVTFTKRNTA